MIEVSSEGIGSISISFREIESVRISGVVLIGTSSCRTVQTNFVDGVLKVNIDPQGDRKAEIGLLKSQLSQQQEESVRNRNRIDELLVLLAQQEDETARCVKEKNHNLKLLSACYKERDKYKAALLRKRKRARK